MLTICNEFSNEFLYFITLTCLLEYNLEVFERYFKRSLIIIVNDLKTVNDFLHILQCLLTNIVTVIRRIIKKSNVFV